MQADGDWQPVKGVLSKNMATVGEYLQTGKLKLGTTKTVSAVLSTEAKRELKSTSSRKPCPEPKYLGVTLVRSLTYR